MTTDYDETRARRRKEPLKTKRKKRVAFMKCKDCGYYYGQPLYVDQTPEQHCPRCGGKVVET